MARIRDIVFDCSNAAALARFWESVLDDYSVRPYDDDEIARLAGLGLTPQTDPSVALDGPGSTLFFQQVPEGKTVKNRVHLDLAADDREHEVDRLVGLGAVVQDAYEGHTRLLDIEGNEFCVLESSVHP